jgi:hypothetical protein
LSSVLVALAGVVGSLCSTASAATLERLTVSPHHPHATWHGSDSFSGPACMTAASCDTIPLRLEDLSQRFLRRAHAVLKVTIDWGGAARTFSLELDDTNGYVRSSAAATDAVQGNPLVQSVAVHLVPHMDFDRRLEILVTPGQSAGGYQGTVRLIRERPAHFFPRAGFDRANLSLASGGPILGAGEPSIAFGPTGTVFVTAPAATPAALGTDPEEGEINRGVIYFRSEDRGRTWTSANIGSGLGGGDSDVVADPAGGVYVQDLALAPSTILEYKSTDEGESFDDEVPFTIDADREWLAMYFPQGAKDTSDTVVYTVYHGLANQEPFICVSKNGGLTNPCVPGVTDPQVQVNALGNTIQGNVVVEKDGDADFLFGTSTLAENLDPGNPTPGTGPLHNLYLAHYDLETGDVTNHTVYLGPNGNWITGLFPVLSIDRGGNLYASWPESPSDAAKHAAGPWALKITHSEDGGETWSEADVMNPPRFDNNLLNWITAGAAGKVNVIWAGTKANSNEYDSRARWYMFFAQTRNALRTHPHFRIRQITPHPIRYGNVCVLGLFCPDDDSRSLLDFAQVEVDRRCSAHVVYGDVSAYIPELLRKNQIFRGDGVSTAYAAQGRRGFELCARGGGAGGAGSWDFR